MKPLFIAALIALPLFLHAAPLTEAQAVSKVKALPEFIDYSKKHKYAFDDNELIKGTTSEGPVWRIDVHTIVSDPAATHLSLWNRFLVSASEGNIMIWNRSETPKYISLKEWREQRKTEQGAAANP